jgi:pimeloyl-ACP methyl ester carboxylesterase
MSLLYKNTATDKNDAETYQKNYSRVLQLVRTYGSNSLSYLSLEKDKKWFFSSSVQGVAAYAVSAGTLVVCGDPVCSKKDLPAFLSELKMFARYLKLHILFLFATAENLQIYNTEGFYFSKAGEEATFLTADYNLKSAGTARIRANIHHAQRTGLTVHEYQPAVHHDKNLERQFFEITAEWLQYKHTSRLQFAVGTVGLNNPNDKRYFYALDRNGTVQGFMVFLPYLQKSGYMADVTRRRRNAPRGTMEIIFYEALLQFKKEAVPYASLGIAPLANVEEGDKKTILTRVFRYFFDNMNFIYGFKPLYQAKNKFVPTRWEPVYFVSSIRIPLISMGYAMTAIVNSRGFGDYVRSFMENHKNGPNSKTFSGFITTADSKLYYRFVTPETMTGAPCLILLHGNHSSHTVFKSFSRHFSQQYPLLLIDTRGHGRSTFGHKKLSFDLFADDVKQIMEKLKINHGIFIGWSDGANTAFTEAIRYPELADGLICISGNLTPYGLNPIVYRGIKLLTLLLQRLAPFSRKVEQEMELFGLMTKHPHITLAQAAKIRCPVLLLNGRFDIIRRRHAEKISEYIPESQLKLIPWAGHMGLFCRPKQYVKEITDFLARIKKTSATVR